MSLEHETLEQRTQRIANAKKLAEGHGSLFKPGDQWGQWTLTKDHMWSRQIHSGNRGLIGRNSTDVFILGSRVLVRTKTIAARLDRGLKIS